MPPVPHKQCCVNADEWTMRKGFTLVSTALSARGREVSKHRAGFGPPAQTLTETARPCLRQPAPMNSPANRDQDYLNTINSSEIASLV